MVWAYTLVSFFVASAIKIGVYRLLDHRAASQARHLQRIERSVEAWSISSIGLACPWEPADARILSSRSLSRRIDELQSPLTEARKGAWSFHGPQTAVVMVSGEHHHRKAAGHGRRPTLIVTSNDGRQVAGLIDVMSILSPALV